MPSPKDGTAGSIVSPKAPKAAQEADKADPGEVEKIKAEQLKTKTGKYGSVKTEPYKPPETAEEKEKKKSWIAIVMMDEAGQPVAGQAYDLELPDGTHQTGCLDEKGQARIEGIDPGACQITFPDLDQDAWEAA